MRRLPRQVIHGLDNSHSSITLQARLHILQAHSHSSSRVVKSMPMLTLIARPLTRH
jgi:hypothetical protein